MRTIRIIFAGILIGLWLQVQAENPSEKKTGFFIYPIVFYSPETAWGFGSTANIFIYPENMKENTRPSTWIPLAIYTQKKQTILRLTNELYWENEKYHWYGTAFWRDYPDKFYGIGNQSTKSQEELFSRRDFGIWAIPQMRFGKSLYAGLEIEYWHQELTDTEAGGVLKTETIPGSESNTVLGLGANLFHDTRDNLFYASKGCYRQFHLLFYNDAWGSNYNYRRVLLDFRQYISLGKGQVLAMQGYCQAISGNPPFHMMSRIGGPNNMRGYYEGRYRNKNMLMFQAEYKQELWKFIDLVFFGGIGDVAGEFDAFSFNGMKTSCGAGLRFQVNPEKVSVRLDFGFGDESPGIYIEASEAF